MAAKAKAKPVAAKEVEAKKPDFEKFIGEVPNKFKTRAKNVYENRFRIDVWVKEEQPDCFVSRIYIAKSWFVKVVDGEIVDLTIKPKPVKQKKF